MNSWLRLIVASLLARAAVAGILVRASSPAVVYTIPEGGAVVWKLAVDASDANLLPQGMQVAGNRRALFLYDDRTKVTRLKLVDLEGKEVAE